MAQIYQTNNFIVKVVEKPHVTRIDGGHIVVRPRNSLLDRTKLEPIMAIELMRLTMLMGEAMAIGLNNRGIDIGRINYQDNGNWSVFKPEGPYLHVHIYGRAKSAKIQKYGDACYFPHRDTGFYDKFEPLNKDDILEIKKQIKRLEKESKYQLSNWQLV